jgi:hypothetical protein
MFVGGQHAERTTSAGEGGDMAQLQVSDHRVYDDTQYVEESRLVRFFWVALSAQLRKYGMYANRIGHLFHQT